MKSGWLQTNTSARFCDKAGYDAVKDDIFSDKDLDDFILWRVSLSKNKNDSLVIKVLDDNVSHYKGQKFTVPLVK